MSFILKDPVYAYYKDFFPNYDQDIKEWMLGWGRGLDGGEENFLIEN